MKYVSIQGTNFSGLNFKCMFTQNTVIGIKINIHVDQNSVEALNTLNREVRFILQNSTSLFFL